MTPPAGPRPPRLLQIDGGAMVWTGRKNDDAPLVAAARAAAIGEAEHEYRRLLYVAMTRAADRLIICGADGLNARPKGCWYDLVRDALESMWVVEEQSEQTVFRYRKQPAGGASEREEPAKDTKIAQHAVAAWLRQAAPARPLRRAPLSPSSAFDEEIGRIADARGSAADRQKALERGRLVHRLMQSLPAIPSERRNDAAEHYFTRAAARFSVDEQRDMARKVFAILEDEQFAAIFAPGSRAEVPIVGRIANGQADPVLVSGQVDRLLIADDAVLIADYKTDRQVPASLAEIAPYIAQLALYRAVLARLYPSKTVRAALVFTEGPSLMEIPAAAMDKALATEMEKALARVLTAVTLE
ncbi:MAG: PD-(D/E)XK nuclease family protein, partial [Xanthobacteraceae bacterium]